MTDGIWTKSFKQIAFKMDLTDRYAVVSATGFEPTAT